mgnify:CR=1 FL=1
MPTTYSLLPVTRIAATPRAHADITLGFSKRGDLSLIFSPAFLAEHAALGVGSKVLIAYSAEAKKLLIAPPPAEQKEHLRGLSRRGLRVRLGAEPSRRHAAPRKAARTRAVGTGGKRRGGPRPQPLCVTLMNPALFSSAKEDWETPREFFERLDGEFHFDLDVCAFPHNAKCPAYFTKEDDGLARDWGKHTCWMNPPYGKAIKAWMTKALDASRRGATVVCLVPSRTDTAWWHDTVIAGGAEVRFVRGRLRFVGAEHPAPFPSAVVIFRPPPSPSQQKETNDENNDPQ